MEDMTKAPKEERLRYSRSGFLGEDEEIEDVIEGDAARCRQLGTTATELGEALGKVVEMAIESGRPEGCVEWKWRKGPSVSIYYLNSRSNGYQYSPFLRKLSDGQEGKWSYKDDEKWNDEVLLSNSPLSSNVVINEFNILEDDVGDAIVIRVGGDHQNGVVRWIREMGFFEGGDVRNPYRIDPTELYSLFTNRRLQNDLLRQRLALFLSNLAKLEHDIINWTLQSDQLEQVSRKSSKYSVLYESLVDRVDSTFIV